MFWRKKTSQSDRIREAARRAAVMHRQHLEYMLLEGSIDQETLYGIVEAHPTTIAKNCEAPINVPQRNPNFEAPKISYAEAAEGIIARIARDLSPWSQTKARLDPLKQGWFSEADDDQLFGDLVVATTFVRSQALSHALPNECNKVEARVLVAVKDMIGGNAGVLYNDFKVKWLAEVAEYRSPQIRLAQEVQKRNCPLISENPFLELSIADLVVTMCWFSWPSLVFAGQLYPD